MVENNSYFENVKDFNMMLFNLDDKDFNWDMHVMIDLIVEKIEAEYTMNCMLDDSNVIHIRQISRRFKMGGPSEICMSWRADCTHRL